MERLCLYSCPCGHWLRQKIDRWRHGYWIRTKIHKVRVFDELNPLWF